MIKHKYIFPFGLLIFNIFNFNISAFEKKNSKNLNSSIALKEKLDLDESLIKENYIKKINLKKFNDFIKADFEKLHIKLSNLISDNKNKDERIQNSFVEVFADSQFEENGVFSAEGNVLVIFKNGQLKTDKLIYDRKNKIIKAIGNIKFSKGKQYFEANYLEFNTISEKGYINDIYGVLDFKRLKQDLNLDLIINKEEVCNEDNLDLLNLPSETRLLNSSNIRVKNNFGFDAIKVNFSKVSTWRFKSKRIDINGDSWSSDMVNFTNDPYNQPQFFVNSKNFSKEEINGNTIFKSKSTFINFDNKVSIPVGRRTISDSTSKAKWGFGYDKKEKDGFYIVRNFEPIIKNKNLSFDLQPYFLLQRAISGESNAFRAKDSSVVSDNVNTDISELDYFAVKGSIRSNLFNSKISSETNLKTLNPERMFDGVSTKFNLLKNIYKSSSSEKNEVKKQCQDNINNENPFTKYKVDLGVYGIFDDSKIYSAYGTKIINSYKYKKNYLKKDYSLVFDIGNFQAKSNQNSNELESLHRYSLNSSFTHKYKIYNPNNTNTIFDNTLKFTPKIIDQGIFLTGNLSSGLNEYSNNQSQSIIQASLGPTFVYGELKKNFLDYTSISLIPEYSYKKGESPFSFDDFNKDSRLKFNIKQQLIGPLLFGFSANLNLNNSSEEYGDLESKEYKLGIRRRAYSIDFIYEVDDEAVLFKFNIFNFEYDRYSETF